MRSVSKIIAFICIAFMAISTFAAENGVWKIHSVFNEKRARILDTKNKVYFVTDNYLNAYNKDTKTFEQFSVNNSLSSYYINNIYYNAAKNYVVITYKDYNIDVILASGSTVNIPDLKNITRVGDRTINDITFGKNGFYVASKVGYLYVEDKNFEVKKASFFNEEIKSVAEVGDKLLFATAKDVLYTGKSNNIKYLSSTTASSLNITGTILPIDSKHFFLNSNVLYLVTIGDNATFTKSAVSSAKVVDIQPTKNGFIAVGGSSSVATNRLYIYDIAGNKKTDIALPSELVNTLLSSQENDGSLWRLGKKGIKNIILDVNNLSIKNKTDELIPNLVSVSRAIAISYNKNNKRLYVTNGCPRGNYTIQEYGTAAQISSYDGNYWKNEVPTDLKGYSFQDPAQLVFDPSEENTYYAGTWFQGVFKVRNNEIVAKYDWTNSTLIHALNNWFCYTPCVQFDASGNLWVLQSTGGYINVLSKNKVSLTELSADDWKTVDLGREFPKSVEFFITSGGYKIVFDGDMDGKIHIFTTDRKFKVKTHKTYDHFYDKNGKKIEWSYVIDIKEDLNGVVWFVTNNGIFSINPADIESDNLYATYPKNDKNYPILNNLISLSIDIDDYNRKWVGTLDDGLFLLNADCTKIIKHFNTSNTCFPNDAVQAVCWNSNTQSVFVGFNGGLLEYIPEIENDINSAFMVPNRITPDFKGKIIFDKLPINSTLYVKKSNGEIVKTLQCNNSKMYWNGITDTNKTLETGLYSISLKLHNSDSVEDNVMNFTVIK